MQYALLIYGDESAGMERFQRLSKEQQDERMAAWWTYTEDLRKAGVHVAGEALQPTAAAKTITVSNGEQLVTDGPFAETKEQLGGFYIVEVESEAEALDWAGRMPSLPDGSVEVRPVMTFDT